MYNPFHILITNSVHKNYLRLAVRADVAAGVMCMMLRMCHPHSVGLPTQELLAARPSHTRTSPARCPALHRHHCIL